MTYDEGEKHRNASSSSKPQYERCIFEFRAKLNCAKWLSASTMENSILNNNEKYSHLRKTNTCIYTWNIEMILGDEITRVTYMKPYEQFHRY